MYVKTLSTSFRSTDRPKYLQYSYGIPPEIGNRSIVPTQPLILAANGVPAVQGHMSFPVTSQLTNGYQGRPSETPR